MIPLTASAGRIVVEDFEDGTVGTFDPFINYQFKDTAEVSARLVADFFSPPGYLLFISRNTLGTLTFNTLPTQSIASVSLEYADYSGARSQPLSSLLVKRGPHNSPSRTQTHHDQHRWPRFGINQ